MSNWVSNSNRVSNSMSNWMSNSMYYWVSNSMSNRVSNSMYYWVSNSMSNWVSNNSGLDNSWSILRNSLIGDILDDSITIVCVLDSLDSSIRKIDSVAARGCVSISGLSLLEVSSTVVITDSILVGIHWGLSKVCRGSNKGNSRGSSSHGEQGSGENSLHIRCWSD